MKELELKDLKPGKKVYMILYPNQLPIFTSEELDKDNLSSECIVLLVEIKKHFKVQNEIKLIEVAW